MKRILLLLPIVFATLHGDRSRVIAASNLKIVSAHDGEHIQRSGSWSSSRFRFAAFSHLHTTSEKASLEHTFTGTGVAIRLGGHDTPEYGPPNLGSLVVSIDDETPRILKPRSLPREVVISDSLSPGSHRIRVEHQIDNSLAGCRIESFQTWDDPRGAVQFSVTAEENGFLRDCRAILRQGDVIIRKTIVRNWLTGQCALTGLAPGDGFTLEVQATGWQTYRSAAFSIETRASFDLPAIYLQRAPATVIERFRFPRLNQPAIRRAGEAFRTRFLAFDSTIEEVRLTRRVGSAVISRVVAFQEDRKAAYYYDREGTVSLPGDMPPGVYDLSVTVKGKGRDGICRSPRSVHVMAEYPTDPVFFCFGHLDTSAQVQAEYIERLIDVANLLAPDVVLCSTAANPAYLSGALSALDAPYVINFGNHQVPGHEKWFGDPVGLTDYGPHLSILNFGHPWHVGTTLADALLTSRSSTDILVINAFEPNAPLDFLNRHQVRFIHDAHGPGERVQKLGATPTQRAGKLNSESFRVIRFRNNEVESCTYHGHRNAQIPFKRNATAPLTLSYAKTNDGRHAANTAIITNRLLDAYPDARVTFIVPAGKYNVNGGKIESQITSDDGRLHVLSVRIDIPENGITEVSVENSN